MVDVSAEKLFNKVYNQTYEEKKKNDSSMLDDKILDKVAENIIIRYQAYSMSCDYDSFLPSFPPLSNPNL